MYVHASDDRYRGVRLRLLRVVGASLVGAVLLGAAPTQDPWTRFFDASREAPVGSLDLLAPRTPTLELPLAARAVDRFEASRDTLVAGAYESFVRWHFWMGEHWDRQRSGLWGTDAVWTPGMSPNELRASALLSSLQLVQLEALANLAARRGLAHDAVVWWTERRHLRSRMGRSLYDPASGDYCDLDSTGTWQPAPPLQSLAPVAFGAPHLATKSLARQRDTWKDVDDRLDSLLVEPIRSKAVRTEHQLAFAIAACRRLYLRTLARDLDRALDMRGLEVGDSIVVATEISPLSLALADLVPTEADAVRRASTAVGFLRRGGFVSAHSHPGIETRLDSLGRERSSLDDETVDRLTDALVEWQESTRTDSRGTWTARREGQLPPDPAGSQFHLQDEDALHWVDRALDLLAEVVVEHALRDRPTSAIRARFRDDLRGRGDATRLVVSVPLDQRSLNPASSQLLWTNGLQVLRPLELHFEAVEGGFEAEVPSVPDTKGIWRAIVIGFDPGPRVAPSLAVIEPVVAEVVALTPTRTQHPHRIRLRNQVSYPIRGNFEVEAPVMWTVDPSARIPYAIGPGETRILEVRLRPNEEASPGSYPVRWHFYDGHTEVSDQRTRAVRPFRWVHIGPFSPQRDEFDLPKGLVPVDLTQSVGSREGPLRWQRLPGADLGPEGEIRLGSADPGWHYALTAFTTGSPQARVRVRSPNPWILFVNSEEVLRSSDARSAGGALVALRQGANQVLVGTWHAGGEPLLCAVVVATNEGEPLAGADDTLEMTLDGYAYLQSEGRPAGQAFARETLRLIPLSYSNPAATRVSVVGSFNGWSPERTPMTRDEEGRWVAGIRVPPGRFEYKFAVDGKHWIADPANPNQSEDGFGGMNSVLLVD